MKKTKKINIAVMEVLHYFNYFQFPLTFSEIHKYLGVKCSSKLLQLTLDQLVEDGEIYFIEENYITDNQRYKVERKRKGRIFADKKMKRARWISRIIYSFPFVKSVSVSGSLSKGYSDEKSDIDYFIITSENNLWTARTLLHIFKKLSFLVGMEHNLCMNYFIAIHHLSIEESNYFTAIELATLIPLRGKKPYYSLMECNEWIINYLPNFKFKIKLEDETDNSNYKSILECLFGGKKLNTTLMKLTDRRWRKKWKKRNFPEEDYDIAFKTTLFVSKNHRDNYQKKLLNHIESK